MISKKQNDLANLELQAAVNTLYSDSKFLMTINFIISVCMPFTLGLIGIVKDYSIFIYLAIFCSLSSIALSCWIKNIRSSAVQMQELYDRSIFNLKWNKLYLGEKPNNRQVTLLSEKYKKKYGDFSEFLNWYTSPAATYQYPMAIILCQSQNLSWDIPNRERYYKTVLAFIVLLIFVFFAVSIYYFENISLFIKTLSASIPIVIFLFFLVLEHKETVKEGNRLNSEIEDALNQLSNNSATDQDVISLAEEVQNAVYSYRKSARPDRDRLSAVNQNQSGNVLNVIRILKYWKQEKRVNIGSYLLEAMILYYYESKPNNTCSEYVDLELENVFNYLANSIINTVADPKNIQSNINDIDYYSRYSLSEKFKTFAQLSRDARQLENEGKDKESINTWKKVFGYNFPDYG